MTNVLYQRMLIWQRCHSIFSFVSDKFTWIIKPLHVVVVSRLTRTVWIILARLPTYNVMITYVARQWQTYNMKNSFLIGSFLFFFEPEEKKSDLIFLFVVFGNWNFSEQYSLVDVHEQILIISISWNKDLWLFPGKRKSSQIINKWEVY